MGINYNKNFTHTKYGISKYMKLSDYFFHFTLKKEKKLDNALQLFFCNVNFPFDIIGISQR